MQAGAMDPKKLWKDDEVVFQVGNDRVTDRAENVVAMINQRFLFYSPTVVQVEAGWSADEDGCFVKIIGGPPYEHHCIYPSFHLKSKKWDPTKMFWTRASPTFNEALSQQSYKAIPGFALLFEVIFASVIADVERLVINPLGHDFVAETLLGKLVVNPKIAQLEFLNQFGKNKESDAEKTRTMNFCCKLLENCTHIKEFFFENLKSYDDESVQKLFEAIGHNQGLETIDLRDNRHMTSWYKPQGLYKKNGRGAISISPLVLALTNPRNRISFSLRNLHLGGTQISSRSVVDLARALPSLGLEKLSIRACDQDKTALVPLVKSLARNMALRELDISHNLFCIEVMEQLCQSLKENKMLQRLVVEHCCINIVHLKCLAEALPDIKSLRYLLMDGNEFTYTPMSPMYGIRLDDIAVELQAGQFQFVWRRREEAEATPYSLGGFYPCKCDGRQ